MTLNLVCLAMQVNSEFQAFKHIESVGKGELMKATRPLEVTLAVYPTLVLTNALPYDMDIVVWQVKHCKLAIYHANSCGKRKPATSSRPSFPVLLCLFLAIALICILDWLIIEAALSFYFWLALLAVVRCCLQIMSM